MISPDEVLRLIDRAAAAPAPEVPAGLREATGEDIGAALAMFGAVIQGRDGTIAWDVFAQELAFRLAATWTPARRRMALSGLSRASTQEGRMSATEALAAALRASQVLTNDGVHSYGPLVATWGEPDTILAALAAAGWSLVQAPPDLATLFQWASGPNAADEPREDCSWCGGDGLEECDDPIQCMRPHIGNEHPCVACGGSGDAKDQTLW